MCGRYVSTTPVGVLAERFEVADVRASDLGERYNVAPTDEVYAVAEGKDGTRRLGTFKWGLVPFWAKDPKVGNRMINARLETVQSKFKRTLERRRCLIPADGFYEWQQHGGVKQPFYIRLADGAPFAMAGLWELWKTHEGDWLQSCTILTTAANELMQPLHDRMPVILPPEQYERWLDPEQRDADALQELMAPFPAQQMAAYPVSRAVNKVGNDGPDLVAPVA